MIGALPLRAHTIHVPADSSTIQSGINGANPGDTVLVAAGIYHETIDFLGKGIVVRGEGGPLNTVITGELDTLNADVVSFVSGEDSTAILERFTVKNGSSTGIRCVASSPLIEDNIITQNGGPWGRGIFAIGNPIILHNYIGNNSGTGINSIGAPSITGNYIVLNAVGIHFDWGSTTPRVQENLIGWNNVDDEFGGILVEGSTEPLIEQNIIVGNRALDPELEYVGGGIHIHDWEATPTIRRNLILRNGRGYGGGIGFQFAMDGTIENNTIVENRGPGIFVEGGGPFGKFIVRNNIIMDNTTWGIAWPHNEDSVNVSYNNIIGNIEGAFGYNADPDTGNISAEPEFRLRNRFDYALYASSPCIDAGDPSSAIPEGGGDRVDIGAYEYSIRFNDVALAFISVPDTVSKGDTLDLECSFTNPFASPVIIDVWFTASGWFGSLTLRQFDDLPVPADTTITTVLSFSVPTETPAGQYNIHGKVGHINEWIADAENAIIQVID
jgi:parallel beta-helix repeat protein